MVGLVEVSGPVVDCRDVRCLDGEIRRERNGVWVWVWD